MWLCFGLPSQTYILLFQGLHFNNYDIWKDVIELAEMSDLSDRVKHAKRLGILGLGCFVIEPLWLVFGIFIWAVMMWEITIRYSEYVKRSTYAVVSRMTLVMILVVTLGVINMMRLRFDGWVGTGILFVNIVTVVSSDTLQYVIGKKMGKRKLSPRLSPNKTMEGFVGGASCSAVIGIIMLLIWSNFVDFGGNFHWLLMLVVAIPLVATVGDLYESALKRQLGIKDYSNILGTHGGFTDRFDANMLVHATLPFLQLQLIV